MTSKEATLNSSAPDEVQQLRQKTLSARLKLLLIAETKERGRYSVLEGKTGIPAGTWRTWWNRGGAPGGHLVEAVAKNWPQFAYWLITGHTDVRCGHDMPSLADAAKGYISNWPEEGTLRNRGINSGYSQQYLKLSSQLDGTETPRSNVEHKMRIETLRVVSSRRLAEISENYKTPLSFEEDV
ncbi:hypothetical protein ACG0Z6_12045 [Roseateles sp. BYS180W]|uniref:Uncharacterized protein n=1 Tax=Roseateles rivi TaxID=3299028 RepID=A0ABW7FX92_9BURK